MKLNRTGSNWNELERNKINENWGIIEGSYNDVVGQITDEVVGHLIDSAKLIWKEPVDTVEDLPANAEVGETRMVRKADPDGISYVYRYDGENWEKIQAIDVTLVNEVDIRISKHINDIDKEMNARVINVKNPPSPLLGAKGDGTSDDTDVINSIIKYANQTGVTGVLFPKGTYLIDPGTKSDASSGGIELLDNVTLLLSDEAVIKSMPTSTGSYNIIRGNFKRNIGVIGGVIEGDRYDHIGDTGEWGHGINLRGCDTVTLDTKVINCWGDGVYLGSGNNLPCTNVYIARLESKNNRRQGISLTHVDGLYGDNLVLRGTNGTNPQAGIDIEPNGNEFVKNVFISTINAKNNSGAGVQVYAEREGALVDNVVIDKVISEGNNYGFLARQNKIKGVTIKTLICRENISDGARIADGAERIFIDLLISSDNGNRGISLSGVKDIIINNAILNDNMANGFEFSGNCRNIKVLSLSINGSSTSDYLISGYSSQRIEIIDSTLNDCKESAIFLSGVTDSFISSNISKVAKYPIRLNNSNRNNFDGLIFNDQIFTSPDTYSLIRIEGSSEGNSFKNATGRLSSGKARYAIQLLNETKNNYIAFFDFKGSVSQSLSSDLGTGNEFSFNRDI